jgi:hypothetical protein
MRAFGGEARLAERTKRKTRQGLQCMTAIHHIPPKMNLIGGNSGRNLCERDAESQGCPRLMRRG